MKKIFRLSGFFFLFILNPFLPHLNAYSGAYLDEEEPEISMDFQDANLKDVLKVFSIQSGLNFISSEAVQDRKITLYLDKVPLKSAMEKLFKANNLSYELDRESKIFIVKDWGKLQAQTETRIFFLKYASVSTSSIKQEMSNLMGKVESVGGEGSEGGQGSSSGGKWQQEESSGITPIVKKLLSSSGSLIEDYRTNSLIVTDTPSRMEVIAQVIASLDVSIPQVLLEVEMLDVRKSAVDQLGVNWPSSLVQLTVSGTRETAFPFGGKGTSGSGREIDPEAGVFGGAGEGWDFGKWSASHFGPSVLTVLGATLSLDFFRSLTDTKSLARPRLLTLNNETAEIRISTSQAIGITTNTTSAGGATGSSTAQAERSETGVILRVTPQINMESGEVTMFIYPKVADANSTSTIVSRGEPNTFLNPEQRSTKSLVRVKDGETVVIAGLIREETGKEINKLPVLGDLPVIGWLFKHEADTVNSQRELLVFITPHIIKDSGSQQLAQARKLALPEREQSTFSAFGRDSKIDSILNNFER